MNQRQDPSSCETSLTSVVQRNVQALIAARERAERNKSLGDHIADAICNWCGSMAFVYLHIGWFAAWIAGNMGALGIEPFDPFPFGLLTMVVSLEAIFLSTFVLVSQNRQAKLGDRRADLDVQIDLLAEHEVTRLLCIVTAIAEKLEVQLPAEPELKELQEDIEPDALLKELEKQETALK